MIRVVVAEDHGIVRAGLVQLLINAADIDVVGVACDGSEAVALASSTRPDVVLMDLSMPGVDGIAATKAICATAPAVRVLILTSFSDPARILGALDAGAAGYVLKDGEPDELYRAIRAVARGEAPLAPEAASVVIAARARPRGPDLTAREREVLALLAQGHPNNVIARQLRISEKTVKSHVTRIFKALQTRNRTQAALCARRQGLV